jgi:hypothetical protein
MPSPITRCLILLFWLSTAAYVGYAEIWPRYFSSAPPALRIDLADEAAQTVPVRWLVFRGEERIGWLTTRMEYLHENDSFRFINTYSKLKFEVAGQQLPVSLMVPDLETVIRVSRSGEMLEQNMKGQIEAYMGPLLLGKAATTMRSQVVNGELVGYCKVDSAFFKLDETLTPVPVAGGQVLNPMMPVSRLRDVQPGRRWIVYEVNPLMQALNSMLRGQKNTPDVLKSLIPEGKATELLAEVKPTSQKLTRKGFDPVECWVIEYSSEKGKARTWVSVADGRVLQQEAENAGEVLRFERQD